MLLLWHKDASVYINSPDPSPNQDINSRHPYQAYVRAQSAAGGFQRLIFYLRNATLANSYADPFVHDQRNSCGGQFLGR